MSIKKATFYSLSNQVVGQVIALISIVIIARILNPSELGVYAIASASIFLAMELQQFGASNYLIREEVITKEMQRRCFGLTLLISWALGLLVIISADHIADFYDIPDLKNILLIFSASFFITPFSMVPQAIMKREMLFHKILAVALTNKITSFAVTMLLLFNDYSYYSMAIGQVSGALIAVLANQLLSPVKTPVIPKFDNTRSIAKIGFSISIANLFDKMSIVISDFVIGKTGSTSDVALFSRGIGFIEFIKNTTSQGTQPVILPYLSQLNRSNQNIGKAYIEITLLLGSILWPAILIAGAINQPAIRLFFGPQWDAVAPLTPGIATWLFFKSIHIYSASLFMTAKRDMLRLILSASIFLITSLTIYFGYKHGLLFLSYALAIVGFVEFLLTSYTLNAFTPFSFTTFIKEAKNTAILCILCVSAVIITRTTIEFPPSEYLVELSLLAVISGLCWISISIYLKLPLLSKIREFTNEALSKY